MKLKTENYQRYYPVLPHMADRKYVEFDLHPVLYFTEFGGGFETCDPDLAQMYSIYGRKKNGLAEWVMDFKSSHHAVSFLKKRNVRNVPVNFFYKNLDKR